MGVILAAVQLNTGEIVNLQTTIAAGARAELKTSGTVGAGGGLAATSIGTYAEGKSIVNFITPVSSVTAADFVSYAFLNRRGAILRCLPVSHDSVQNQAVPMYGGPVVLQAGDTIEVYVLNTTAQKRNVAYNVICNDGTHAIFDLEAATGASSQSLTHVLSGQGLGQSLTNRQIVAHYATSLEPNRYAGQSILVVNDRGLPQGGVVAVDVANLQPQMMMSGLSAIGLNFEAQIITIS